MTLGMWNIVLTLVSVACSIVVVQGQRTWTDCGKHRNSVTLPFHSPLNSKQAYTLSAFTCNALYNCLLNCCCVLVNGAQNNQIEFKNFQFEEIRNIFEKDGRQNF